MDSRIIPLPLFTTSVSTKRTELELLHGVPRCGVAMSSRVDQAKIGSQHCGQRSRIVPHDRQSAASLRAVKVKGADDDISTSLDGSLQPVDIGGLIGLISQEMKGRSVVPQIVGFGWLPGGDVSNDPFDASSRLTKTLPGCLERGAGKIQDRDLPHLAFDKAINQPRRTAADIDDRRIRGNSSKSISSRDGAGFSWNQLTSLSPLVV
jgi:hypothetical protein